MGYVTKLICLYYVIYPKIGGGTHAKRFRVLASWMVVSTASVAACVGTISVLLATLLSVPS